MDQIELLRQVVDALESIGIPYMVTGSIASSFYGEPRMTRDIDIVVAVRESHVDALCGAFGGGAFYIDATMVRQAISRHSMFGLIHSPSGNKVDFIVADDTPHDLEAFARSAPRDLVPDRSIRIVAMEDLILAKMRYFREGESPKHPRDILAMLQTNQPGVDTDYIATHAEEQGLLDIWEAIVARLHEN